MERTRGADRGAHDRRLLRLRIAVVLAALVAVVLAVLSILVT